MLMIAALLAGCGGDEAGTPADDTMVAEAGAAVPAAEPVAEDPSAPLAVEDIDRWQRGMEAELGAVQAAATRLQNARTGEDTLGAIYGANESSTRSAGASAAGVSEDRYQFLRSTLSTAVGQLSPLEQEMDLSQMPAPMVEEMKKAREAGLAQLSRDLPAEVLEALRPRAAELRKQDVALTGERMKAAGIGR